MVSDKEIEFILKIRKMLSDNGIVLRRIASYWYDFLSLENGESAEVEDVIDYPEIQAEDENA